jgi:hypothetical protein
VSLPTPRPGLVISYSYLWAAERRAGAEEGVKTRPCAIVAAHQIIGGREVVTVVPVTHAKPSNLTDAIEIPAAVKVHLGLEVNDFLWPGPDLRPVSRTKPATFEFGMLPPRFFAHLRDRILQAHRNRKLDRVARSE